MVTLGDVAALLGVSLDNAADPGLSLDGIAPLHRAGPSQLAFITDRKYLPELAAARAAAVLLREEWVKECPVPALCVADPYLAYARVSRLFEVPAATPAGVHPQAVVDPSADVAPSASIGPHVYVAAGAVIGDGVVIGSGSHVGERARIGARCWLAPRVVIYHDVILGERCRVHSATVIGADGFGFAHRGDGWERISQLGAVRIGHDVDIGAGVTIDRGALDDTLIDDHVIIDDQVHIAHNVSIGARTAIAGCVGIAGSTSIGADCTMAGQVGVSGHLQICDNVHLKGQARVTRSIDEPGSYSSGTPLDGTRAWGRNAVRFTQLEAMHRRILALENALESALAARTAPSDAREADEDRA